MTYSIQFENVDDLQETVTTIKYANKVKGIPLDTAMQLLETMGAKNLEAGLREIAFSQGITDNLEGRYVLTQENKVLKVKSCQPIYNSDSDEYIVIFEGINMAYKYDSVLTSIYVNTPIILMILPEMHVDLAKEPSIEDWVIAPLPDKPSKKSKAK